MIRSIATLVACALLAACGFHLAGDRPLPPALADLYIDFDSPYTVTEPPLQAALQARIESRGGQVKSKMDQAKNVLRLTDLSETREVLSVGPDGKAVEYRLVTRVTYELR